MGTWSPGPGPTSGNDTFTGDGTGETANGGDGIDTLNGNGGNDTLMGGAGDDNINAGDGDDLILPGDDYLDDFVIGGNGIDTVDYSALLEDGIVGSLGSIYRGAGPFFSDNLYDVEIIRGTQANDRLVGTGDQQFEGPKDLYGLGGDDYLVGVSGAIMYGGEGRDVFAAAINSSGDVVADFEVGVDYFLDSAVSFTTIGADTLVQFSGYALRIVGVTGLSLSQWQAHEIGTADSEQNSPNVANVTGTSMADWYYLGGGNDTANGGGGGDMISGGLGNDTINGGAGDDRLEGGSGNDLINGGADNDRLKGDSGDDTLLGGAGADALDGGLGTDIASYSDSTVGVTIDLANPSSNTGDGVGDTYTGIEGILGSAHADTLRGDAGNNILRGGNGADVLEGRDGADTLEGGAGNDVHDGGAGADAMSGAAGDDIYVVDNAGDVVTEFSSSGTDIVYTSITYTLTANVEQLAALGSEAINLFGNGLANFMVGNSALNALDGGAGADTLIGGGGDDLYFVDNIADVIIEVAGEGVADVVYTSLAFYQLGDNVEQLSVTASTGTFAVGNSVVNLIVGNAGADALDGGAGADTLVGGAGNDSYYVDNIADVIIEVAGEGAADVVYTSLAFYQLGDNVEQLSVTAATGTFAAGNSVNNLIVGNAGADALDGGAGADTLVGGGGNDSYFVDNIADVIIELTGEGDADVVYTSLAFYQLGDNVEQLSVTAASGTFAVGNSVDNLIVGNAGADALEGRGGADVLVGGDGADTFVYNNAGEGGDVITDFVAGVDVIRISAAGFGGGLVSGGATPFVSGSDPSAVGASFLYDTDDGRLFWDSDGSGGAAAILIATLSGAPALAQSDILIGP